MPPSEDVLPIDEDRPFREPWQAKAFALVVLLHRQGHFAWPEWVQTLATEVKASPQRPDEDADQAYHRQFLAALERVVIVRGLMARDAMTERTEAWRRAYLNTPHGQPVDLAAADDHHAHGADEHEHALTPRRMPVAVSAAHSGPAG